MEVMMMRMVMGMMMMGMMMMGMMMGMMGSSSSISSSFLNLNWNLTVFFSFLRQWFCLLARAR